MASVFLATADTTFADYDIIDEQINTLKDYIKDTITVADAAKRIASHPEASSTPLELQRRLGGLWTLLNETAVSAKAAQPKIVSLLQAIRQVPQVKVPAGEGGGSIESEEGHYWRELTNWTNNWADASNGYASRYLNEHPIDDQVREQQKTAWSNACAYTARLAATGDEALSYGAGLDRATSAISEALEVDTAGEEPKNLDAAAQLFKYASPELYRRCKENQGEGMLTSKDSRWRGDRGFFNARWKFWFERWSTFAGKQSFSHHVRRLATEVCSAMETAERSG